MTFSMMWPVFPLQKPKANPPGKPAALTEEEKEILKNRDMLENMDLLKDFEKFRLFDLFAEGSQPETGKESKKPEKQKDEKKTK